VLCTPTATPPAWVMAPLGPESQPHGRDGRPREPGSRRHYCHSSEPFRAACEEIVTAFARRLGGHPAVVAWQTDNESVPSGGRARAAPMHYNEMRNSQKKKKKKKKKTHNRRYSCHDTAVSYSPCALRAFRVWLCTRYGGDIDKLNAAWGNTFWSLAYTTFDEVGVFFGFWLFGFFFLPARFKVNVLSTQPLPSNNL
jgi:beta-galactosidase